MADPVFVDNVTPLNAVNMNKLQTRDEEGQPNGYASLDSSGKVPLAQLPPVGADLVYQGDFPAGTPYTDGEIVVYNGVAYMCVTPTSAAPTPWPGTAYATPPTPVTAYGTTLPASPADGQEAILVDSLTNPSYQWRFRFNASSTSPYKWEFIGGAPRVVKVTSSDNVTSASYVDIPNGPSFTLPRSGDYDVFISALVSKNVTAGDVYLSAGNATVGNLVDYVVSVGSSANMSFAGRDVLLAVAAGQVVAMRGANSAGNVNYIRRSLEITPRRVS